MKLNYHRGIQVFGSIEIAIGAITLLSIIISLILQASHKPLNVLWFVIITSAISLTLGIGLLLKKPLASQLLSYFAFSIILTKVLIFIRIISLNGALETSIPAPVKNIISLIYHFLILVFFHLPAVRKELKA